jgi:hypothetical protein
MEILKKSAEWKIESTLGKNRSCVSTMQLGEAAQANNITFRKNITSSRYYISPNQPLSDFFSSSRTIPGRR